MTNLTSARLPQKARSQARPPSLRTRRHVDHGARRPPRGLHSVIAPYVSDPLPPEATRIGRPTDYRVEHCQAVLDDAALGHTLGATAAIFGVARSTLMDWASRHPEFAEACTRAKSIRQRFYEGHALDIVRRGGDSTRAQMTLRGLVNVAADDWKEKVTTESTVTISLAGLINESMKLAGPTFEGESAEGPTDE